MLTAKLNKRGGKQDQRDILIKYCEEWKHFSLTSADSLDCFLIQEHFQVVMGIPSARRMVDNFIWEK